LQVKLFEAEAFMTRIIEAAGMLLFALETPPKFLLMRHHNRWDLPKGHAEEGEDILTTALRETEEETGIQRSDIRIDADFRFLTEYDVRGQKRGDYRKRVTYFLGYVSAVRPITLTEHLSYLWWTWPQPERIQTQTIDPLVAAAREHFLKFPQRLQNEGE
jgi:bis(5'-nucleosidyl)-tetraphosphatase